MRATIGTLALGLMVLLGLACSGETQVVKEVVTVEVEKVVERVVVVEVAVEKVVTVEVEVERVVEKEVAVEKPVVVEVEVEKIVEVEAEVPAYKAVDLARYGGTLRVAAQSSIFTLDCMFACAGVTMAVTDHIYERLFGHGRRCRSAAHHGRYVDRHRWRRDVDIHLARRDEVPRRRVCDGGGCRAIVLQGEP